MNLLKKIIDKFKNAFNGVLYGILTDSSIMIQFSIMIVAVVLGFILKLSQNDFITVIILSGLVISLEFINSAIELLSDFICRKNYSITIKRVKDMAAGAVLVISITALIVGIMIFSKYL